MKVIFLDIDGVLNDENSPSMSNQLFDPQDIDIKYVKRLNKIIEKTGAKIVVSSSWRKSISYGLGLTIDELRETLNNRGLNGEIIDITPHLYGIDNERPEEIEDWLNNCEYEIDSFVILDDYWANKFKAKFPNNFVHQVNSAGLQDDQVDRAIEILTNGKKS